MIVYDLVCEKEHQFESWFKNSSAYDFLRKGKKISCPICNSTKIRKAPMAPNISSSIKKGVHLKKIDTENSHEIKNLPNSIEMNSSVKKALDALSELQSTIEKNFENVGRKFPEEARKIHYGEVEKRGIYGEATADETEELIEEGVDIAVLPWGKKRTS